METSIGHVFVSHASADRATADRMVEEIERHGISCWISHRDIAPGADYQHCIVAAMDDACAILLLFSTEASRSAEVPKELALASKRRKLIVPARMEDIFPTGALAYQLTNAQFIDLFNNYRLAMQRLIETLAELRGMPKPAVVAMSPKVRWPRNGLIAFAAAVLLFGGVAAVLVWKQPSTGVTLPDGNGATTSDAASRPVEQAPLSSPTSDRKSGTSQSSASAPADGISPVPPPAEQKPASPPPPEHQAGNLPSARPQDGGPPATSPAGHADPGALPPSVPTAKPPPPITRAASMLRELGAAGGMTRAAKLKALLSQERPEGISVADAMELLGDIPAPFSRRDAIKQLLPALKRPLGVEDVMALLQPFDGNARAMTLDVLLPCVSQPMNDEQVEQVLADIPNARRSGLSRTLQAPPSSTACSAL